MAALVAVVLVAVAVRVFVLGNEQVEHFFRSESPGYRPPEGEWIRSVPGARAEFWAVGDSAGGSGREIAALIERADPDRVLYLGDVYPDGHRHRLPRVGPRLGTARAGDGADAGEPRLAGGQ